MMHLTDQTHDWEKGVPVLMLTTHFPSFLKVGQEVVGMERGIL